MGRFSYFAYTLSYTLTHTHTHTHKVTRMGKDVHKYSCRGKAASTFVHISVVKQLL